MKNADSIFITLLFTVVAIPVVHTLITTNPVERIPNALETAAASYFTESVNLEALQNRYAEAVQGRDVVDNRIKILIVPGHDEENVGARFGSLTEVELNRELGAYLYDFLAHEPGFKVVLAADAGGFRNDIQEYLEKNAAEIKDFETTYKNATATLEELGTLSFENLVAHNAATEEVVHVLYGINKYVNDNDFDIVLHVHFNDHPGREENSGDYRGFSIYVPESQFSNGRASKQFATHMYEAFKKLLPVSNHPLEQAGVVEDNELIAIGAYNTVEPIAALIEYGYIYEPHIVNKDTRSIALKELAYQTATAVTSFFSPDRAQQTTPSSLVPYTWKTFIDEDADQNVDALALETLLAITDMQDEQTCYVDGVFEDCTQESLEAFQKAYGLVESGKFDGGTRAFASDLF